MPFYIRKSISLGPLRFNLSKSGIGVSAGVRGFRVGSGPRGNYIHVGTGGLYYRTTLTPPRNSSGTPERRQRLASNDLGCGSCGPMEDITTESISRMVDSSSTALLAELDSKQKRLAFFPLAAVAATLLLVGLLVSEVDLAITSFLFVLGAAIVVAAYCWDLLKKIAVVMYDLDGSSASAFQGLYEAFGELAGAEKLWHISARGNVLDPKYHAGAGHVVNRGGISVGVKSPPFVRTNVDVFRIPTSNGNLYFLPDTILCYARDGVGAVGYEDIKIEVGAKRFIEEGVVPRDAKIVDRTWKFVNKGGGPDRRFKDNRELPICEYEEIHLHSDSGLSELLQASRTGRGHELRAAVSSMAAMLKTARSLPVAQHTDAVNRLAMAEPKQLEERMEVEKAEGRPVTASQFQGRNPDVHEALFRILCCVMVADGQASSIEKTRMAELMKGAGASWDSNQVAARISAFVKELREAGFREVFSNALTYAPVFVALNRSELLTTSIQSLAHADGSFKEAEGKVVSLILRELEMRSTNSGR